MQAPAQADVIDDVKPIRRRVEEKAKVYGKLDAPLVIAVDAVSSFTSDGDVVSALVGSTAVQFYMNALPGAPAPRVARLSDGLLVGPTGWRRRSVSALVTTWMLKPWRVATTIPTWWAHPGAQHPLEHPASIFRTALVDPATGALGYEEPITPPHEYFGLHEDWPGFREGE